MATRAPGSYIWLPHETDIFVPAKVLTAFKPGEPTKCQSDDGETHNLTDTAKIDVCDSQCLDSSIDNLIMARCRRVPWRVDVLSSAGGPLVGQRSQRELAPPHPTRPFQAGQDLQ